MTLRSWGSPQYQKTCQYSDPSFWLNICTEKTHLTCKKLSRVKREAWSHLHSSRSSHSSQGYRIEKTKTKTDTCRVGVSLKPTQIDATASRHLLPLPAESRKAAEKPKTENRKTKTENRKPKTENWKTGKKFGLQNMLIPKSDILFAFCCDKSFISSTCIP